MTLLIDDEGVVVKESECPHCRRMFCAQCKNSRRNSSLQMASMEQKKADEKVLKLAEEQKRKNEDLLKRILKLEKQLDAKQALELGI
ncbi:hypothetical protein IFM89_009542 [Coptis chinensis]|uniref:Uncharacterized protein n=1 Tax=Coptis chinensis TaxID=261450 RepID=A0A835IBA2_9MAGN|nr:hypothetical protein IFM89_009542 [Coptis chinensis]